MDQRTRDIERQASVEGWTDELREAWVRQQDRVNPEGPIRKSLHKRSKGHIHKNIAFVKGSPKFTWRERKDIVFTIPFEFNDLMLFVKLKKASTSRTVATFRSTQYPGYIAEMNIRDLSTAVPYMCNGILKGRFAWKTYKDGGQWITFIEEI